MSRWQVVVLALLLVASAGCAEATAEVSTSDTADATQLDPQLVRAAELVLADAPTPEPGWRVGVVVAEKTTQRTDLFGGKWDDLGLGVLTADGLVYLDECESGSEPKMDEELSTLVDPGDLITWTGKKRELCSSKVRVLRKFAAVQPTPTTGRG